jgi:hypothetical protein
VSSRSNSSMMRARSAGSSIWDCSITLSGCRPP